MKMIKSFAIVAAPTTLSIADITAAAGGMPSSSSGKTDSYGNTASWSKSQDTYYRGYNHLPRETKDNVRSEGASRRDEKRVTEAYGDRGLSRPRDVDVGYGTRSANGQR